MMTNALESFAETYYRYVLGCKIVERNVFVSDGAIALPYGVITNPPPPQIYAQGEVDLIGIEATGGTVKIHICEATLDADCYGSAAACKAAVREKFTRATGYITEHLSWLPIQEVGYEFWAPYITPDKRKAVTQLKGFGTITVVNLNTHFERRKRLVAKLATLPVNELSPTAQLIAMDGYLKRKQQNRGRSKTKKPAPSTVVLTTAPVP